MSRPILLGHRRGGRAGRRRLRVGSSSPALRPRRSRQTCRAAAPRTAPGAVARDPAAVVATVEYFAGGNTISFLDLGGGAIGIAEMAPARAEFVSVSMMEHAQQATPLEVYLAVRPAGTEVPATAGAGPQRDGDGAKRRSGAPAARGPDGGRGRTGRPARDMGHTPASRPGCSGSPTWEAALARGVHQVPGGGGCPQLLGGVHVLPGGAGLLRHQHQLEDLSGRVQSATTSTSCGWTVTAGSGASGPG